MKTYTKYLKEIIKNRYDELTQNTIDFKAVQAGKIQVIVKDEKNGKIVINKLFAGDLLVKQILNKIIYEAGLKPTIDPSIEKIKDKTLESITDNSIIEFQINQNGVLIVNADMFKKIKV